MSFNHYISAFLKKSIPEKIIPKIKITPSIYSIILNFFEVANLIDNVEVIKPKTETGKKRIV